MTNEEVEGAAAMPKDMKKLIITNIQAQLASAQSDINFNKQMIETLNKSIKDYKHQLEGVETRKLMLTKALIYMENHAEEE